MGLQCKRLRLFDALGARSFLELMNRIRYRDESSVVERGGKPIGEFLPARPPKFTGADLVALLRCLPKRDEGYPAVMEKLIAKQSTVAESRSEKRSSSFSSASRILRGLLGWFPRPPKEPFRIL
jgi:hypothetical protein